MFSIIITAIGTVLFTMYAVGIVDDGTVLIAAAILIVGGMIKTELGALVGLLQSEYMFSCYDEYYDDCDGGDRDCGDDEDEEK